MRAVLALVLVLACRPSAVEEAPADAPSAEGEWGASTRTQQSKYRVALAFEPSPPPLGELFAAEATVTLPDGTPVEDAEVTIDARMPQHDHGMETRPELDPGRCEGEDCVHPGGVYRATGFKFHMRGAWTVIVDVDGPRGLDNASFVYEMQ